MVLLKVPVSPRKWPVAMPEPLAMVKVGNKECGLEKFTPLSRTAAKVGAVSGVTDNGRRPSGTNRIKLRGVCASAEAICRKMAVHVPSSSAFDRNDIEFSRFSLVQRQAGYARRKTGL